MGCFKSVFFYSWSQEAELRAGLGGTGIPKLKVCPPNQIHIIIKEDILIYCISYYLYF